MHIRNSGEKNRKKRENEGRKKIVQEQTIAEITKVQISSYATNPKKRKMRQISIDQGQLDQYEQLFPNA